MGSIKAVVHREGSSKANGTSLQDYMKITYRELVEAFGEPLGPSADDKVAAEWHVSLYDGYANWSGPESGFVTIYNYKDGKNYLGANGLNIEDITDWHIGGKALAHVHLLEEYLGQKLVSK